MKKSILFLLLTVLGVMNGVAADYPVATQEQLNSIVEAPADVEFELLQPCSTDEIYLWTYNSSNNCIYQESYPGGDSDKRLKLAIKTKGFYKVTFTGYNDNWSSEYKHSVSSDAGDNIQTTENYDFSTTVNCCSVVEIWHYWGSSYSYLSKIKIEKSTEPIPTVTYTQEGKLGAEILKLPGVKELNDVKVLKINGPIGEFDYKVLNEMDNLAYLDMSDATAVNDEIPESTFDGRVNLANVYLPSTLKSIGKSCFYYCSNLKQVWIPSSVKTIDEETFRNCSSLIYVLGCEGVENIDTYAFYSCNSLRKVEGCQNLKQIGERAFYGCSSLTEFTDMSTVESIGNRAFESANCAQNLNLVNCKTIGLYVFSGNKNIKTVNLREATSIGEYAFYGCTGLESVNLKSAVTIAKYAFYGCTSLKSLNLPSLESIGNYAFRDCEAMESLVLSDKLTNLGTETFYNCKALKSIVLPASIAKCDPSVFTECRNVTRVECNAPTPPNATLDNAPFAMDVMLKATLVVQSASIPSYKAHPYWKYFANWEESPTRITDLVVTSDMLLTEGVRLDKLNLTLKNGGGSMTINGSQLQELKKVVFESDGNTASQFLSNCEAVSSDNTFIEYSMTGNKWFYITLPFDADIAKLQVTDDALYAICRYDGATRATNGIGASWTRVYDGTLKAGTGYIVQCNKATKMTFTATDATLNSAFNNDAIATSVSEFTSSRGTADAGWNFVGNPYMTYYDIYYMDFTAPITVWNGSTYTAYSVADDDLALKPMQPFFIQCPVGTSKITFNTAGRQLTSTIDHGTASGAKAMSVNGSRKVYNLELADMDGKKDMTRIVVNATMSDDYEMECDAAKMMSDNEDVPQLWTMRGGISYAINEGKQMGGTVALSMYIPQDGTYTIAATRADDTIMLYDALTKETTDLSNGSYTFQAVEGELNARFTVLVAEDSATCVGGVSAANDAFAKAAVFSLDGKKAGKNYKGIVVRNGKKIFSK